MQLYQCPFVLDMKTLQSRTTTATTEKVSHTRKGSRAGRGSCRVVRSVGICTMNLTAESFISKEYLCHFRQSEIIITDCYSNFYPAVQFPGFRCTGKRRNILQSALMD